MSENDSLLSGASPKLTFLLGALVGITVISTVGFFIALTKLSDDGTSTTAKANTNTAAVADTNTNTGATATQPATLTNFTMPAGDDVYFYGNEDAPIKLVGYSDYECSYCKQHHSTMQQVLDQYGDQVAWVWRHYPLSFHANAQKEAEAAECAGALGGNDAFWEFSNAIMDRTTSNGTGFALTALAPLAEEIGLDNTAFQKCLDSGTYAAAVQNEAAEGASFGIGGTPSTIIYNEGTGGAQMIEGALPYASFTSVIDEAIATL